MGQLATKVYTHNVCAHFTCVVCGDEFEQYNAAASIFYVDNPNDPGDICRECLRAGKRGAAERARKYAARLARWAAEVETMAEEIPGLDWPTIDQLEEAERKAAQHPEYVTQEAPENADPEQMPF